MATLLRGVLVIFNAMTQNLHTQLAKRIKRVKRALHASEQSAALLLTTAPPQIRSLDSHYEYRPDSNFFYLTGSRIRNAALIISTEHEQPLLIGAKRPKAQVVWEGSEESLHQIAARCGATLIQSSEERSKILEALRGVRVLYHQGYPSRGLQIVKTLLELPAAQRRIYPTTFSHSDNLLAALRLLKDPQEITAIKEAAALTCDAYYKILPMIRPGVTEKEIAASIQHCFRAQGALPAFPPIVASGMAAATLHYDKLERNLREDDLLLVDIGAELNLYAADMTRVFPVSGVFDDLQAKLYETVLRAQKAAIKAVRPGATIAKVYQQAALMILEGLVSLKILNGKVARLMERHAERSYFPHSIGHQLGLDVHDVSIQPHNATAVSTVLKPGMVITIEPGIYFPKRIKKIKPCGIRIEDDVLVTPKGHQVLSSGFPKELAELEGLLR
ncbi:MAG: aminopeptidase P family protein [Bdellovibrionales bacterium]|nr:aminopeptidase P family protein [Bdellovibrionales bacterium]